MASSNRFIIEGVVYKSAVEAAKACGIKTSTFHSRIKSNTKTWENWQRLDNHIIPAKILINSQFYLNIDDAIAELCIIKIKRNKLLEYKKKSNKNDPRLISKFSLINVRINSKRYENISKAISELCIIKLQREVLLLNK